MLQNPVTYQEHRGEPTENIEITSNAIALVCNDIQYTDVSG